MLEPLGLTAAEQALYERLLRASPVAAAELEEHAALCARLQELGLVTLLPEDPPRYAAVAPGMGLDALLRSRTRELTAARARIAGLSAAFHRARVEREPAGLVEVVIGRPAVMERFDRLQRDTHRSIRVLDAPPYAGVVGENALEFELLARGVDYRVIYDRKAMEQPGALAVVTDYIAAGEHARVGEVPMKLVLNDRPMAILPLRHDLHMAESALVVHDPAVLEALAALFEMSWQRAMPLGMRHGLARLPETRSPADAHADLLPLLIAGLTDAAIGAQLGWSARTVRRHVHTMMAQLDAQTRFQAGYQAVVRGWLS
ncbi:transcriptional regulator [Nonomuraea sp. NPDC050663]|uniref:transcriptional regulator n=1 Tax=Nonomuraea sp. NPDC050663 TaxID=3364370 RepID=UPI0037AA378E